MCRGIRMDFINSTGGFFWNMVMAFQCCQTYYLEFVRITSVTLVSLDRINIYSDFVQLICNSLCLMTVFHVLFLQDNAYTTIHWPSKFERFISCEACIGYVANLTQFPTFTANKCKLAMYRHQHPVDTSQYYMVQTKEDSCL